MRSNYINVPMRRENTSMMMMRPHSKAELISLSKEMSKSKSIYLDKIKDDVERKA